MKLTHPLLTKIAQQLIDKTPQQLRDPLERAVMAGNKIMYSEKTSRMFKNQMSQKLPLPELVGEGAAKLMGILYADSQKQLPMRVLIPAGMILVLQALEFMMDSGVIEDVDNKLVAESTKEFTSAFLQLLGVTPQALEQILQKGTAEMARKQQAARQPQQPMQPEPQQPGGIIAGQQGAM